MSVTKPARAGRKELARSIRHRIRQRTWGRIQRLRVRVDRDRVIVRGSSATYHSKQLALTAVQEVIGSPEPLLVVLEVQVENGLAPDNGHVK